MTLLLKGLQSQKSIAQIHVCYTLHTGFLHNLFLLEEWPQLGTTDLSRGTEEVAESHWLLNILLRVSLLLSFHKLKQVTQLANDIGKLNYPKG